MNLYFFMIGGFYEVIKPEIITFTNLFYTAIVLLIALKCYVKTPFKQKADFPIYANSDIFSLHSSSLEKPSIPIKGAKSKWSKAVLILLILIIIFNPFYMFFFSTGYYP